MERPRQTTDRKILRREIRFHAESPGGLERVHVRLDLPVTRTLLHRNEVRDRDHGHDADDDHDDHELDEGETLLPRNHGSPPPPGVRRVPIPVHLMRHER